MFPGNKNITNLIIIILLFFYSCTSSPRYGQYSSTRKTPRLKKSSKLQNPADIKTKGIKHRKVMNGVSSFYAEDFHGKLTANGEIYDMYGVTAAHKTLPLNTVCRVTNTSNKKSLILRINDRGPYIKGRILDCSYGAAKKLDFINQGTTKVKIEVIEWGDGKYMQHRKLHK
jgi:rare lipoprotein A